MIVVALRAQKRVGQFRGACSNRVFFKIPSIHQYFPHLILGIGLFGIAPRPRHHLLKESGQLVGFRLMAAVNQTPRLYLGASVFRGSGAPIHLKFRRAALGPRLPSV